MNSSLHHDRSGSVILAALVIAAVVATLAILVPTLQATIALRGLLLSA